MRQVKEICNSAPSFEVNSDYRWFVVNKMTGKIVSGWEYKDDAIDSRNEFNEWGNGMQYKVMSVRQLCNSYYMSGSNPFDSVNWSNS